MRDPDEVERELRGLDAEVDASLRRLQESAERADEALQEVIDSRARTRRRANALLAIGLSAELVVVTLLYLADENRLVGALLASLILAGTAAFLALRDHARIWISAQEPAGDLEIPPAEVEVPPGEPTTRLSSREELRLHRALDEREDLIARVHRPRDREDLTDALTELISYAQRRLTEETEEVDGETGEPG